MPTTWACWSSEVSTPMAAHEEQLRRLALHDEAFIESMLAMDLKWSPPDAACRLSPKAHALVRLAALLALGAAPVSYQWSVEAALDADATTEEILGTMIAVPPSAGSPGCRPPPTSPSSSATTSTPRSRSSTEASIPGGGGSSQIGTSHSAFHPSRALSGLRLVDGV
jgi:4-carboxymuconolactone decarboxylase